MESRYLFRGKRTDNGEWVQGNLITNVFFRLGQSIPYILCPDKAEYDCFEDFSEENGIFEIRPESICQCAGYEGIYEKDIFQCDDEVYVIEWCDYSLSWEAQAVGSSESISLGEFSPDEIIVIGNAIDNPELLEV